VKKKDRKKEILEVSARLFAKQGFEKTTTRDICKATGLSHAMVYYYFDDKAAILNEILDQILREGLRRIKKIAASDKDLVEKLAEITDMYAEYHVAEVEKMRVFIHEQRSLKPHHKKRVDKHQREYLKIITSILVELKQQGKLANLDTTVTAFTFFGMVHWAYGWYNPQGRIKPKQLSEMISRIFIHGILSDEAICKT
jgi:AcrR family transcriptional regulator